MGKSPCKSRILCPYLGRCSLSRLVMRFQVIMIDKKNKIFEETIVAGNMEEAKKTAQKSNSEVKIVSAHWVYK